MKINGASPTSPASRTSRTSGAGGGTFEPAAGATAPRAAAPAAAPIGVGSIDALLALQAEGFDERRRRAAGRASTLLDILDEIKIALLEGGVSRARLNELVGALNVTRDDTQDAKLESVLDEVETRALVELAKHEARAA
jgi:hypothetical protein